MEVRDGRRYLRSGSLQPVKFQEEGRTNGSASAGKKVAWRDGGGVGGVRAESGRKEG